MEYSWQFHVIYKFWPVFVQGALMTLQITLGAIALGILIGVPMGVARQSQSALWRWLSTIYVEFIRSTPALVQIVWVYYCFPVLFQIQLEPLTALIITLGIHSGSYIAEIVRGGIESVDRGQFMAARSIGMGQLMALRRIILPQAVPRMIPPFINEFANQMKLSTLGSTIAVYELLQQSNNLISQTYRPLEIYTFLALVFFVITFPWIFLSRQLEKKLQKNA